MAETAENLWNLRVLEHESWLRTVVRSRLAAPHEVDDVMQSVLTDAFAFSARQAEVRSLGPWLYRLAINGVLQFRRKCGRRRKLHNAYANTTNQVGECGPLELLLGDERRDLIQQTLSSMSGEDVEILLLKYVHGWNYSKISEQLGLEGHRVAHRLRRARNRLKERLHKQGLGNE